MIAEGISFIGRANSLNGMAKFAKKAFWLLPKNCRIRSKQPIRIWEQNPMMHPQWQTVNSEIAKLTGALDRDKVPLLWQTLQQWQPETGQFEVSLQNVERIDSAGMVMLIHPIEHAKRKLPYNAQFCARRAAHTNSVEQYWRVDVPNIYKFPTGWIVDSTQLKEILDQALNLQEIHCKAEGSHYEVIAVDECFWINEPCEETTANIRSINGIY